MAEAPVLARIHLLPSHAPLAAPCTHSVLLQPVLLHKQSNETQESAQRNLFRAKYQIEHSPSLAALMQTNNIPDAFQIRLFIDKSLVTFVTIYRIQSNSTQNDAPAQSNSSQNDAPAQSNLSQNDAPAQSNSSQYEALAQSNSSKNEAVFQDAQILVKIVLRYVDKSWRIVHIDAKPDVRPMQPLLHRLHTSILAIGESGAEPTGLAQSLSVFSDLSLYASGRMADDLCDGAEIEGAETQIAAQAILQALQPQLRSQVILTPRLLSPSRRDWIGARLNECVGKIAYENDPWSSWTEILTSMQQICRAFEHVDGLRQVLLRSKVNMTTNETHWMQKYGEAALASAAAERAIVESVRMLLQQSFDNVSARESSQVYEVDKCTPDTMHSRLKCETLHARGNERQQRITMPVFPAQLSPAHDTHAVDGHDKLESGHGDALQMHVSPRVAPDDDQFINDVPPDGICAESEDHQLKCHDELDRSHDEGTEMGFQDNKGTETERKYDIRQDNTHVAAAVEDTRRCSHDDGYQEVAHANLKDNQQGDASLCKVHAENGQLIRGNECGNEIESLASLPTNADQVRADPLEQPHLLVNGTHSQVLCETAQPLSLLEDDLSSSDANADSEPTLSMLERDISEVEDEFDPPAGRRKKKRLSLLECDISCSSESDDVSVVADDVHDNSASEPTPRPLRHGRPVIVSDQECSDAEMVHCGNESACSNAPLSADCTPPPNIFNLQAWSPPTPTARGDSEPGAIANIIPRTMSESSIDDSSDDFFNDAGTGRMTRAIVGQGEACEEERLFPHFISLAAMTKRRIFAHVQYALQFEDASTRGRIPGGAAADAEFGQGKVLKKRKGGGVRNGWRTDRGGRRTYYDDQGRKSTGRVAYSKYRRTLESRVP